MNKKYYIETYGCQMNVYDSELVAGQLIKLGYNKTKRLEAADIILLNTCSIREKAEETVSNRLDSMHYLKKKKPGLLIGVLGCMAQNLKNDLLESKPYVDVILGPDSYRRIPEIINNRKGTSKHQVDTRLSKHEVYEDLFPLRKNSVNAWISISRGCDKFCTFCIVPFTRGRERSRSLDSIVREVEGVIQKGFVEITLLGQNVNSYRTENGKFPDLLEAISAIRGVKRIRCMSPQPQDMDEYLLQVMSNHENICNYIHLPLQSGSDRILRRMNRTYTKSEFLSLVDIIREYLPGCAISTDIIVGFPGETEKEFEETLQVMDKVIFDRAFMFKYSSRPGTKAEHFSDHIDEKIKQSRLEKIIKIQKKITADMNKELIGTVQEIIVEKESKKSNSSWAGRTMGNTWVIFNKGTYKIKDKVKLLIYDAQGVSLFGKKINLKEPYYETN